MDSSGSIGITNFNTMKGGMAKAFGAVLPIDGSVEVTIVEFSTSLVTVVHNQVINSAADRAAIVAAVNAMAFLDQNTDMGGAINLLNSWVLGGHLIGSANQVYNIVTDGEPCCTSNADAVAIAARNAALSGGLDEFDAEFLGSTSAPGFAFLRDSIVWLHPGHLAPPYDPGFLVSVGYDNFEAAFTAKLVAVTQPIPEPGTLLLIGSGLVGLLARRRRS